MNALTKQHDRAMDFAELADAARLRKEPVRQREWLAKALTEELKAVAVCVRDEVPEPTFSIIHRSAATLALDCGQYRRAEKLAAGALAGQPPPEIAGELLALLARARSSGTTAPTSPPPPRKPVGRLPVSGREGTESASITLQLRKGEPVENALLRLKKRIDREGPAKAMLIHLSFPIETPTARRRAGRGVTGIGLEKLGCPQP